MPKKKRLEKITRVQLALTENDYNILIETSRLKNGNLNATTTKALKILNSLIKEEVYLITPKGDRIPNSIIFS